MSHGPPLRVALVALLTAAPAAMAAGGVDGTSVPSSAGGFAGAADPGARGVIFNPTAPAHGEAPEILLDVGLLGLAYTSQLDQNTAPETISALAPHPTLAASVPLGRFAVGGFVHAPYFRSASGSGVFMIETGVTGAFRVTDWLTVGAGARIGAAQFGLDIDIDTGEFLNENVPLEGKLELPLGEPFLQGQQSMPERLGFGVSPMFGATATLPGGTRVHATFRPRWVVPIRGEVALQPSYEFQALVEGGVAIRMPFPARFGLSAAIPIGRFTLLPEVEYVGWGRASDVEFDLQNLRISASDAEWTALLVGAGLAETELLDAAEGPQTYALGWHSVIHPSLQVQARVTDDVDVRAGLLWVRSAVPDEIVSPTNVDFETWTVRAAGAWRLIPQLRLSGTVEAFPGPTRRPVSATGERGLYQLGLWRAGITAQWFFVPGRDGDT